MAEPLAVIVPSFSNSYSVPDLKSVVVKNGITVGLFASVLVILNSLPSGKPWSPPAPPGGPFVPTVIPELAVPAGPFAPCAPVGP